MPFHLKTLVILLTLTLAQAASAQESFARQDHAALRQTVEQFLRVQTGGLPGRVDISVGPVDPRLNLPACAALEAFLPGGGRAWGKTAVGVRCGAPSSWTVYISAGVRVHGEYVAAAAPLAQGQALAANDMVKVKGELTALPPGIVTDPSQAVGRTMSMSVPAGAPLRQDALRAQQAVQQGQTVRVVTSGAGFQISTEARALNNAGEGQITQARTANGQIVSGVAKMGGIVEVNY